MDFRSFQWLMVCLCAAVVGCGRGGTTTMPGSADLRLDPSPPTVGESHVSLQLADAAGQPLRATEVHLEGNMNHAGMQPSFAELHEVKPGKYEGTLQFTMGGDWFVLVTAKMPDGQKLERKIEVPGVKNQ